MEPNIPKLMNSAMTLIAGERPAPEQAQRQHGMGAAQLPRHEARQPSGADRERAQHPRTRPPVGVGPDQAQHRAEQARGGEHHAPEVERLTRARRTRPGATAPAPPGRSRRGR